MKYGITFKSRKYSPEGHPLVEYERKQYYGILSCPKDKWASKAEVRNSRAFKRLSKEKRNPRIVKK
jgi:hypothetical protein